MAAHAVGWQRYGRIWVARRALGAAAVAGREPLTCMFVTEPTSHALMSALKAAAPVNKLCGAGAHGSRSAVID